MAANTVLNLGAGGDTIATDDVAGVKLQRVKIALGATGVDGGNISTTNKFPVAFSPHDVNGLTLLHADAAYTATQTSATLYATTATKKFAVTDITLCLFTTTSTIGMQVNIYDAAIATAFTQGTTKSVLRAFLIPTSTAAPGIVKQFPVPWVSTTASNYILITTSSFNTGQTLYVQLNGYEI